MFLGMSHAQMGGSSSTPPVCQKEAQLQLACLFPLNQSINVIFACIHLIWKQHQLICHGCHWSSGPESTTTSQSRASHLQSKHKHIPYLGCANMRSVYQPHSKLSVRRRAMCYGKTPTHKAPARKLPRRMTNASESSLGST